MSIDKYKLHQQLDNQGTMRLSEAMQLGIKDPIENHEEIDNVFKVALILLLVGPDVSAEVLRQLTPEDVQRISSRMATMQFLEKETVVQVLDEFKEITTSHASIGGKDILAETIKLLGEGEPPRLHGLEAFASFGTDELYSIIKNEHPQIVASLATFLKPEQTSALMEMFPEEKRNELMLRIALLDKVDPDAMRVLNDAMMQVVGKVAEKGVSGVGGISPVADILNLMDIQKNESAINSIREHDPELADLIVEKMFVFEDFLTVEDGSLETLLLDVPQNVLILALKGASPKLRDKIFGNLTRRTAERIRDELDTLPPVRVSEVQENQREIIQLARRLAGEGKIYLRSAQKDDLI
jgi:flagellar motor switch protein FliG